MVSWIPINPYARGSYDRIAAIFRLFEELLIRSHTEQYKYHAFLAVSWMRGSSLRELVANKVERARAGTNVHKINAAIRELFNDLESELRFKYVKYMRIYSDVLRAVLMEKGLSDEANALLPIHLFLEYGAANQTLISLMAIGMSRTSSILFKSYLSLRDNVNASECRGYVDRVNIERTSLPAICKSEINRLRRVRA